MPKRIFITATNTDIGKTYVMQWLIRELSARGHRVGALKPIETGVTKEAPDGAALLQTLRACNPLFEPFDVEAIVPVRYELPAAPFIASGGTTIDFAPIDAALERIEAVCDVVLIEGAGGLLVPVDPTQMMIDLIPRFRAKALLVSHGALGCINDTLLSLEALRNRGIKHEWVLNIPDSLEAFERISGPYFDQAFDTYFVLQKNPEALIDALMA